MMATAVLVCLVVAWCATPCLSLLPLPRATYICSRCYHGALYRNQEASTRKHLVQVGKVFRLLALVALERGLGDQRCTGSPCKLLHRIGPRML